ncbi:unnamed protein product [Vitrella brassicaformis CCMP3155]|uniref:non-specific serine/threonine protein kinase n=5 Tax=Vitrella brassicaformis TaxID=1169539 RepID=A0A0G4E8G2_VITBC|nr:unnamed protein product [Vitrella brassicaformis CCMP3155]|eukprot:CEL91608.1 unnamed protein product [Vitrella brassicaformis CCMP3155]
MGNTLPSSSGSRGYELDVRTFLFEYPDVVFQNLLASNRLFRVIRCLHETDGPVVVKLFVRPPEPLPSPGPDKHHLPEDLEQIQQQLLAIKSAFSPQIHPNVFPFQRVELSDRSACLVRPFFAHNLYERFHTRPFLTPLRLQWVAFQLLAGLCQAHSMGVSHGDLKTENVLVTSWLHAYLGDFASFKPVYLPENDPALFSLFFESESRRRCYLAPERLYSSPQELKSFSLSLSARLRMDVFSMGCVLAELFSEGTSVLDLPQLLQLRANALDPTNWPAVTRLTDDTVRGLLVRLMLQKDPAKRTDAIACFEAFCRDVFPRCFMTVLFPLYVLLLHPLYQSPDMRVALVRENLPAILEGLLGAEGGAREEIRQRVDEQVPEIDALTTYQILLNAASIAPAVLDSRILGAAWAKEHTTNSSADHTDSQDGSKGMREASPFPHPVLDQERGEEFSRRLVDLWRKTGKMFLDAEQSPGTAQPMARDAVDAARASLYDVFFRPSQPHNAPQPPPPPPSLHARPCVCPKDDTVTILVGLLCSCVAHVSSPRCRAVCVGMLRCLAPYSTSPCLLELTIPCVLQLLNDPVGVIRAVTVECVLEAVGQVEEVPAGDAHLMTEYVFPSLLNCVASPQLLDGTMSGPTSLQLQPNFEPSLRRSLARSVAALAKAGVLFIEKELQRRSRLSSSTPSASAAVAEERTDAAANSDTFDGRLAQLRELVRQLIQGLLAGDDPNVKIALLETVGELAEFLGRKEAHNFLLPYLITFMNDPHGSVRAHFCEHLPAVAPLVGAVAVEGFIYPCFDQALIDPEEEVVEAGLKGLASMVSQKLFRQSRMLSIARSVAPLLLHPSSYLRQAACTLMQAIEVELSPAGSLALLYPLIRHVLTKRPPFPTHGALERYLKPPASRKALFRAVQTIREEMSQGSVRHTNEEGATQPQPAPAAVTDQELSASDREAVEVLRPFLQGVLTLQSSRYPNMHLYGVGGMSPLPGSSHSEGDARTTYGMRTVSRVPPHTLPCVQASPLHANFPTRVRAELDDFCRIPPHTPAAASDHTSPPTIPPSLPSTPSLPPSSEPTERPAAAPLANVKASTRRPPCVDESGNWIDWRLDSLEAPTPPLDLGVLTGLDGSPYSLYAHLPPPPSHPPPPPTSHPHRDSDMSTADGRGPFERAATAGVGWFVSTSGDLLYDWDGELDPSERPGERSVSGPSPPSLIPGIPGYVTAPSEGKEAREAEGMLLSPVSHASQPFSLEIGAPSISGAMAGGSMVGLSTWRPQGLLVSTLYEHEGGGGCPVTHIDVTDDGRILVSGGANGRMKLWNCASLEKDVSVTSVKTFALPRGTSLTALRTIRNTKGAAVGGSDGIVRLYKLEVARGGMAHEVAAIKTSAEGSAGGQPSTSALSIAAIQHFDTDFESVVVFATEGGVLQGWDLRAPPHRETSLGFHLTTPFSWGNLYSLCLAPDSRWLCVGTLGGVIALYDLRFLAPMRVWRLTSALPILSLAPCREQLQQAGVFAALGGANNEVALFDLANGRCATLFRTNAPSSESGEGLGSQVPTLTDISALELSASPPSINVTPANRSHGLHTLSVDVMQSNLRHAFHSSHNVRSIWAPPPSLQTFILAGGTDRKVRYLSLERCTSDSYVVIGGQGSGGRDAAAASSSFASYAATNVDSTLVVQEYTQGGGGGSSHGGGYGRQDSDLYGEGEMMNEGGMAHTGRFEGLGDVSEMGPMPPSPHHRDAILDVRVMSLSSHLMITSGRDGLVKIWK